MKIKTKVLGLIAFAVFSVVGVGGEMTDAERHNSTMMNANPITSSQLAGDVRVVFIGNSITLHGKAPQIGWTNEWGMAASAAEKDYVHLVTKGIERRAGRKAAVMVKNLYAFECDYRGYDFSDIDDLVAFNPDYLVVAIGENVRDLTTEDDRLAYRVAFKKLLSRFVHDGRRPNAVVRGVFWANPAKDGQMSSAAADMSMAFVRTDFCNTETMAGTNRFAHAGVAAHPGDVGMRRIADVILEAFFRPVEVRVRKTPNGPGLFVDGKRVRPRFLYGSPACLCNISDVNKEVFQIPFRAPVDTGKGEIAVNGYEGDDPMWFSNLTLVDVTAGTTNVVSDAGEVRTRNFRQGGLTFVKDHFYRAFITHRATHFRTYFTHEVSYLDGKGTRIVLPLPYGDTLGETAAMSLTFWRKKKSASARNWLCRFAKEKRASSKSKGNKDL